MVLCGFFPGVAWYCACTSWILQAAPDIMTTVWEVSPMNTSWHQSPDRLFSLERITFISFFSGHSLDYVEHRSRIYQKYRGRFLEVV